MSEVRFAENWIGSAMSGALLYAARRADDGTIERASDGHDGQAKMLGAFGRHSRPPCSLSCSRQTASLLLPYELLNSP
ncbi:hypothetical protein ACH5AL_38440 [Actinacidiphila glaucinigra]|uniref:hypothetical protein n=1 Tax=Actinacidiphila glaucinigra TaxID=235986 RepID=UPI00379E53F0